MGDTDVVRNAHQDNHNGKNLFIFSMVFVLVFFVYLTFIHPHSSPDTVKELREQAATGQTPDAPADQAAPQESK